MSFDVDPDELRTHASHVDALVDRLNTAVDAANTVVMDDSAYGLLCAFLPPIINKTTQDDATDALRAAVEGMGNTADNVRAAADGYEEQDRSNAAPFEAQLRADVAVAE
ncbi:Excreted virulence factor EspC, type VII ESX diderm [Amycolatopsis sacchari]|uniref:Excreted virulence factor EspC, type VII ESX diderm n=1 Tax=Amycolatopsis sacchari TaxID=115433 RepID=A0A1I3ULG1_9PSEU|nr:type VII secretion target [Amycolatopsis sacchari]SFJ82577.1 Excreted virulence factor EspC, type VII ESX diderm [Amycolatopsis sacchari]